MVMDNFDEHIKEMLSNDFELFPKKGDFYFIKNQHMKKILTFDYKIFNSSPILLYKKDFNSDFWKFIRLSCYSGHTDLSFYNSVNILEHILKYGWEEFIIEYYNKINKINKI